MRLGVLDVGSNTVHLQVFETFPGSRPSPTSNLKVELRLAEYVSSDGLVSAEGVRRLRDAIAQCIEQYKSSGAQELLPFATSALREAKNGGEIIASINRDFELDLQVLSGEEEAGMTFLAARRWYGWSSGRLLVVDIGGGSLEVAVGVNESPDVALSLPLGALRLTKDHLEEDPYSKKSIRRLREYVDAQIGEILPTLVQHQDADRAIGTSKTLRTIARLCGDWSDGNGRDIKGESLRRIIPRLSEMTEDQRRDLPGVSATRARQIVAGAFVAESVMRNLEIDELEICPWALREGIILKWLDWARG
jgi:exopolyphosphatase/guanosine-5'-triphosphate,3'-diphosphate pyrophosphatase